MDTSTRGPLRPKESDGNFRGTRGPRVAVAKSSSLIPQIIETSEQDL
jgi:hypothetical protein